MTVSFTFTPGRSMLESELNLQTAMNAAASVATGECLKRFDTDGSRLIHGESKMTSKGLTPKVYQTPYGEIAIERHVYQSSKGGATFCPLESDARLMRTATPLFAKQTSFKYANSNAETAMKDFGQHGRTIAHSYINEVALDVASVVEEKNTVWNYTLPIAPAGTKVSKIGIGIDGTCTLMCGDGGWRQAMVGTISFYDEKGERISTIYIASAPESGKAGFLAKMDAEIKQVKKRYPDVIYAGIADGAHDNWIWLGGHCSWEILDFWHVSEYISEVKPLMRRGVNAQAEWMENACHRLKHETGTAAKLLKEMEEKQRELKGSRRNTEALDKAVSYLTNHLKRMNYACYQAMDLPIGSGVTEAACKSVVKERMCGSGMKWSQTGMESVLNLRALTKSEGRWEEFWQKTEQYGFAKIRIPKRPIKNTNND